MLFSVLKHHGTVYLALLLLLFVAISACGSPPAGVDQPLTATLTKDAPLDDVQQLHSHRVVLYWHEGDLWRAKADGSDRQQLTQERYFEHWSSDPQSDPWWFGGPPPQPYVSPDGRWLVASVDGRQFAVIDLSGSELPRLFPGTAVHFSWSPDSRHIAYGQDKLNILDVVAGQLLEGIESRPGNVDDIVWSPDGQEIAFACCFRSDKEQAGFEVGDIYRYRLAGAAAEIAGETWRGVASGTPGLCWTDGRPTPADEKEVRSQCSPQPIIPRAESPDGLWQAELAGYSPEMNVFTELLVTASADGHERLRLDLSGYEPPLDLRRIFWAPDGGTLLLGSYWLGEAIYRLDLSAAGELTPIVDDGVLMGAISQWDSP